ncbi:unnamed protein product [Withania somnifera]
MYFNQQLLFLSTASSPLVREQVSVPILELTHNNNNSCKFHSGIINALKISAKMGNLDEGRHIHANIIKLGMTNVLSLGNLLLHFYVKCKEIVDARKLFDEMGMRKIVTWNTLKCGLTQLHCAIMKLGCNQSCFLGAALVDLYGKFGLVGEARRVLDGVLARAFLLFSLMRLEGFEGYEFTFASLVNSCANLGFYDSGRQIQGLVIKVRLNEDVVNEHIADARKAFDAMAFRNVVCWITIIVGYGRRGDGKEAMELLRRMLREGFVPDELTLASVLSSCGNLSMATETVQVHAYAVKHVFSTSSSIGNALINAYSKCGSIAQVYRSFSLIKAPDLFSWTSMIGAYALHGFSKEAIRLFEEMLVKGAKPDGIVFLGVLSSCSHGGLFSKGLHMLSSEHYTCLVGLFGQLGLVNEAYEILNSMPVESQLDSLKAFIGACKFFVIDPNDTATYVLMTNLYASDSNRPHAALIWDKARNRLHKSPGCSMEIARGINTLA